MATELTNGTLLGNPSYAFGCETVCGTKMKWSLNVNQDDINVRGGVKKSFIKVQKFNSNFIINMEAEDTAGGVCTGKWKTPDKPQSYVMEVTVKHMYQGKRLLKDSEFLVVSGQPTIIPITEYGSYTFEFEAHEWGEDCNKPSNTQKWTVSVEEPETTQPPTQNGNGEPPITIQPDDNEELFDPIFYPIAMIAGIGAFVVVSSLFPRN